MFLIYQPGLRGPVPAKVDQLPTNGTGKLCANILAQYELPPMHEMWPLFELEKQYPPPAAA